MNRWAIFCLVICFKSTPLVAQVKSINPEELYPSSYFTPPQPNRELLDSLLALTKHHVDDTIKVKLFNQLFQLYHSYKNDSALIFAEKAYRLAIEIDHPRAICRSLSSLGIYYGTFGTNEFEKSLQFFQQQAELAEKNNFEHEMQDALSCILNLHFYTGDFTQAMKLSTQALAKAEKMNDPKQIAYYNNLLGFIYLRQGNPEQARHFYQQYFDNAARAADSIMMTEANIGLAEVFLYEGNSQKAIPLLIKAFGQLTRAQKIDINLLKTEKIPYSLFALARAYSNQGEYEVALNYCLQGFKYSEQFPFNLYDLANYYIITGNVYENLGRVRLAIETFHRGLSLSLQIKHVENIRDAYQSLARIYAEQGIFDSAFYYERQYNFMKDSITNVQVRREIEQINAEYNLEKKEQQHQGEMAQQQLIIGSIIAFFLFVVSTVALLYNRFRLKQKAQFQLELNRRQNELFNAVTTIQDKERKRIAQDIHDQVGSVLSAAKLQLSGLEELKVQLTDGQKQTYASAMILMDRAAEELRNISHNLMPATLSRLGLVAALRGLFNQISEYSGLTIHFNAHGFEKRIDEPIEINIYPMVLELINNVVKHANASEATVQIINYPEYINITVEDNGVGFNVDGLTKVNGVGILNLKSRVDFLKGNINIDAAKGKGTTVMIDIPNRA